MTCTYAASEDVIAGFESKDLCAALDHDDNTLVDTLDEAVSLVEQRVKPGDVVVFMGAGKVSLSAHKFYNDSSRLNNLPDQKDQASINV